MDTINNFLDRYFIFTNNRNNKLKFETIDQFNMFINNTIKYLNELNSDDLFSNMAENDKKMIKNIIFNYNYPRKLKPYAKGLYYYTNVENLLFCALNLCTIELEKSLIYRKNGDSYIVSAGSYNSESNKMRYQYNDAIPHEFLHMSSTSVIKKRNNTNVGFGKVKNGKFLSVGLNEGYTELLSRRIFFNENYFADAYITNVYSLRLLELLYDKKEDMEKDYLTANKENLLKTFLNYMNEEEIKKIIKLLNIQEWERNKEDKIKLLKYIKKIVKRTQDQNKIQQSEEIEDEFQFIISKQKA